MTTIERWGHAAALAAALTATSGSAVRAQTLPSEPLVVGHGRLTVGGDLTATFSCASTNAVPPDSGSCPDDRGFFNYTDYEHSALRMLRLDLTAALEASRHFSVLGDVRSENADTPAVYALYLRVKPWTTRDLDIQVGRVPPTFGAFGRRTYASDNLLIGYPLAYQYLTSLRPDSLPANADDLLKMRGRGWLSSFSTGNTTPHPGMPIASAFRWDTGVQVHAAISVFDVAAAVTNGTLGNPLVKDDNSGKQVAGRVQLQPTVGLIVGVSGASGPFVTQHTAELLNIADRSGSFTQSAWGADAEYSRGYYLVRFEAIISDWNLPILQTPAITLPLRAIATSVEGRYKIRPGLYAAARVDHLGFSEIMGSAGTATWDAPVTRVEIGGTYSLQRNLQLKLSFQHNTRDAGPATRVNLLTAQLVFWL